MENLNLQHYAGMVYWVHIKPWTLLAHCDFPALLHKPLEELDENIGIEKQVKSLRLEFFSSMEHIWRMGFRHLRTNVSWAEWNEPFGREWIQWYLPKLAMRFDLMACLNYTPKGLAEPDARGKFLTNAPPRDLSDFARFVRELLASLGESIGVVQLWNEPNLRTDWNPELDRTGEKFVRMVKPAAKAVKSLGKVAAIGGLNKLDLEWFGRFCDLGGLENIDWVCLNGLRGTLNECKIPPSWPERLSLLSEKIYQKTGNQPPVIISEAGYPTIDYRTNPFPQQYLEVIQCSVFAHDLLQAREANTPFYWYTLRDLQWGFAALGEAITGWKDHLQHCFGCVSASGQNKLLGRLLLEGGAERVLAYVEENNCRNLWQTVINRKETKYSA